MAKKRTFPSNPDSLTSSTPVDESAVPPTADAPAAPVEPAAEQAAIQGETPDMACANCGDNTPLPNAFNEATANATKREDGFVQLAFTGPYEGPVTFFGIYDGCKSCPPVWADPNDVARLLNTGMWAVVEAAPAAPVA